MNVENLFEKINTLIYEKRKICEVAIFDANVFDLRKRIFNQACYQITENAQNQYMPLRSFFRIFL